jgi:cystathionine beta-lyase/cystathionine gamma-synthase
MKEDLKMKKETQCVHSGTILDKSNGGINSPIFTSSAFNYLDREQTSYPRYFNTPNQSAVVEKLCALEAAENGVLFSSGMAAISTTILAFTKTGDHVVMMDELYGGTHAFATNEFKRLGIEFSFAATHANAVCKNVKSNTKVVVIESPTNPLLSLIDIKKVAQFARKNDLITIIDNTFASPINQNPLKLGIDIVVHSGTKYFSGHSDICCGAALTTSEKTDQIRNMALSLGGSLNATTCYLLERSLKTLALRVERQSENAMHIAKFLVRQPAVKQVYYPGLETGKGYDIAKSQMSGFGGMLSFELDQENVSALQFVRALRLIKPAVSLGGVETTICSPAKTSHVKMTALERERIGITDALLRLSVGIEQVDDLLEDLTQALN